VRDGDSSEHADGAQLSGSSGEQGEIGWQVSSVGQNHVLKVRR
jgi:hypothetical protein